MHELSIADNLVQIACEYAVREQAKGICAITVKIGALTCVQESALRLCFESVVEGTLLEGAELKIIEVPVVIFCSQCNREVTLPGIQQFCCSVCGTPGGQVRHGNELDLESIEVIDEPSTACEPGC